MAFYRLLTWLILAAAAPVFALRRLCGLQPIPARWRDRLTPPAPDGGTGGGAGGETGPVIWLHGASNGELTAARHVIEALLRRDPALRLLVTANTPTGRDMVARWSLPRITAHLAPFDERRVTDRFLDATRPAALIVIENEIWPNRLLLAAGRGIPVLMLSARLSAKSAARWQRYLPGLARRLTGTISWLGPQDAASGQRFVDLGLPADRIGPIMVLKSFIKTSGAATLPFARETTILAASTHEREEEIVLEAFVLARARQPGLHLILAPRHPRRRAAIEAAIKARGLSFTTRSRGAEPDAATPVYLADTLGEMDRWYRGAGMCFVGGSLVNKGGHTPFEPAAHGAAILHGPHVENSAPAYAALKAAAAAVAVSDAQSLADAIHELTDKTRQRELVTAAQAALAGFGTPDLTEFFNALDDASHGRTAPRK